jgi:hypothetical protein
MFTIEVNGTNYSCVSSLTEMNLGRTRQVMGLIKENSTLSSPEKNRELIFLLSNIPPDKINKFSDGDISKVLEKIKFLHKIELAAIPIEFRIGKKVFKLIDFDGLTVNEYAAIEYYFLNYRNEYDVLHKILNVLLRRVIKHKSDILFSIKGALFYKNVIPVKLKKFTFVKEVEDNSQLFDERLDGSFALLILHSFNEWSNNLKKEFPDLWPTYVEDLETPTEEEKEAEVSNSVFTKWGMYAQICSISSSAQERDYWEDKNIRELLKYLTFMTIKNREELRLSRLNK